MRRSHILFRLHSCPFLSPPSIQYLWYLQSQGSVSGVSVSGDIVYYIKNGEERIHSINKDTGDHIQSVA